MDFKLDENFGRAVQKLFRQHGHDCPTVRDERLRGADDPTVLDAACAEHRVPVTLDHDSGNVLRYPPDATPGTIVLNPPGRPSMGLLRMLVAGLLDALRTRGVQGKLWIVEPGRIREHESSASSDAEQ